MNDTMQTSMPWASVTATKKRAPVATTGFDGTVLRTVFPRYEIHTAVFRVVIMEMAGGGELAWVGEMPPLRDGVRYQATGALEQDKKRGGEQLRVASVEAVVERTIDGILAYLSSGAIPHVGPVMAGRIVAHFGDATLDVIDAAPERLAEVKGIKAESDKLAKIVAAWTENRSKCTAMMWLCERGVSANMSRRIVDEYGASTIDTVRANPYRLAADVDGIGFDRADDIALKLGLAKDSPARAIAAVIQALHDASGQGHCYLPERELVQKAAALVELAPAAIYDAVAALTVGDAEKIGGVGGNVISLKHLSEAERWLAQRILDLLAATPSPAAGGKIAKTKVAKAIVAFEKKTSMKLAPAQREAVLLAATSPIVVITGGPGTGKSTILRVILAAYDSLKVDVLLCAPTGMASKRMAAITGHAALTIHKTLEWNAQARRFAKGLGDPIGAGVVVVDEASMCDLSLARHLVEAVKLGHRLILMGDVDQLPSVSPGAVLRDIITSGMVPTVRLTQIFRQSKGSAIITAAHAINDGVAPTSDTGPKGEFYVLPKKPAEGKARELEQEEVADLIVELVTQRIPNAFGIGFEDMLILTPMHKGDAGTIGLNNRLREVLNPPDAGKRELERGDKLFRVGDRVRQKKNCTQREIFNGDTGILVSIREATADDPTVMVVRFDGRDVKYDGRQVSELVPAYATTVHSAQGSEAKAVILVMHRAHHVMLSRPILYTGATRGKNLVILVSDARTIRKALDETRKEARYTLLAQRLRGEIQ